jgi:thiazole tautomerase (transcriptional regulator TenI)
VASDDAAAPVIHAVTNDEIIHRPDFLASARAVMSALGPRGAIQLRASRTDGGVLFDLGEALAAGQAATGAWLVVTDRVDLALAVGARAVQLTAHSVTCSDARSIAAPMQVGASIHSLDEAAVARTDGAAWGVVGKVFSGEGSPVPARGMALLLDVLRSRALPVIVIGGVVAQHAGPLRRLGVSGVAAIRGIWDAENPARSAIDYLSSYDRQPDH